MANRRMWYVAAAIYLSINGIVVAGVITQKRPKEQPQRLCEKLELDSDSERKREREKKVG